MKVVMPMNDNDPKAKTSNVFGRCQYFALFDTTTKNVRVFPNPGAGASGGAGVSASREVISEGANSVIATRFGPKAQHVLESAGLKLLVVSERKSIEEHVEELGLQD